MSYEYQWYYALYHEFSTIFVSSKIINVFRGYFNVILSKVTLASGNNNDVIMLKKASPVL